MPKYTYEEMTEAQEENEKYVAICRNLQRLQRDLQELHLEAELSSAGLLMEFQASDRWRGADRDSCGAVLQKIKDDIAGEGEAIDTILKAAYAKADAKRIETANRLIEEIYPNLDGGAELHARWDYFTK